MSGMFPATVGSAPQQLQSALAQIHAAGMMKKQLTEQEKRLDMELKGMESRQRDRERSQHVLQKQRAINNALIAGDVDAAMAIWSTYGGPEDGTPQQFGIPESAVQRAQQAPGLPAIGAGAGTAPAVGGGIGRPGTLIGPLKPPAPVTMPGTPTGVPAEPPVTLPGATPQAETIPFPYKGSGEAYKRPSEEYLGRMRETQKAKTRSTGRGGDRALALWKSMRIAKTSVDTMIPRIRSGITQKEIANAQVEAATQEEKRMWGMVMAFGKDIKSIEDKERAIHFLQSEAKRLNEQMEHLQTTQLRGMFPAQTPEEKGSAEVSKLVDEMDRSLLQETRSGTRR